jgi:hypothetical protein
MKLTYVFTFTYILSITNYALQYNNPSKFNFYTPQINDKLFPFNKSYFPPFILFIFWFTL